MDRKKQALGLLALAWALGLGAWAVLGAQREASRAAPAHLSSKDGVERPLLPATKSDAGSGLRPKYEEPLLPATKAAITDSIGGLQQRRGTAIAPGGMGAPGQGSSESEEAASTSSGGTQ